MKFSIRTTCGSVEVEGTMVKNTIGMKMFVHKDIFNLKPNFPVWVVSEFYTGTFICKATSKKEATGLALKKERNADYWPDVEKRIEYNKKIVEDMIKEYGMINFDIDE